MSYFQTALTEELCLIEIHQLATNPNLFWLLLEAEGVFGQLKRLEGEMSSGTVDKEVVHDKLTNLLKNTDFGDWDAMNVKDQMLDLWKARKNGKIDPENYQRRVREIKKDAFLYNTVYAIGRKLWDMVSSGSKQIVTDMFKQADMNKQEYGVNQDILNWQPSGRNTQRAQQVANQLVDMVGYRQALRLLQSAA